MVVVVDKDPFHTEKCKRPFFGEQKGKAWSKSTLGRAGDGARELLPWTAGSSKQKNFDPEHPLARESKGRSLAFVYIQYSLCGSFLLLTMYFAPTADPCGPQCQRARVNIY